MARKKRRSSKFKDGSTVIDIQEARKQRQDRQRQRQAQQERQQQRRQDKARRKQPRTDSGAQAAAARKTRAEGQPAGTSRVRQDRRKMALRRRKRSRNLAIAAALAALALIVVISLGHIVVLKHDLYTAQKEQAAYEMEKEQLEKDLRLIDDKENLEEQARNQMRLIMPGETLYIFPENMTQQ